MANGPKRYVPKRPPTPHSKGLGRMPMLPIRLDAGLLLALKDRARYETLHWRLEHGGRGRVISPADIARRVLAEYFKNVSPLPDDAIGAAVRATEAAKTD